MQAAASLKRQQSPEGISCSAGAGTWSWNACKVVFIMSFQQFQASWPTLFPNIHLDFLIFLNIYHKDRSLLVASWSCCHRPRGTGPDSDPGCVRKGIKLKLTRKQYLAQRQNKRKCYYRLCFLRTWFAASLSFNVDPNSGNI